MSPFSRAELSRFLRKVYQSPQVANAVFETLISLPANEGITRHFQAGLARRGLDWPIGIEVDSTELDETPAANDFGIGLSVAIPKAKISSEVRVLNLDDFAPVVVATFWRGKLTGLTGVFLDELHRRAQRLLT